MASEELYEVTAPPPPAPAPPATPPHPAPPAARLAPCHPQRQGPGPAAPGGGTEGGQEPERCRPWPARPPPVPPGPLRTPRVPPRSPRCPGAALTAAAARPRGERATAACKEACKEACKAELAPGSGTGLRVCVCVCKGRGKRGGGVGALLPAGAVPAAECCATILRAAMPNATIAPCPEPQRRARLPEEPGGLPSWGSRAGAPRTLGGRRAGWQQGKGFGVAAGGAVTAQLRISCPVCGNFHILALN